MTSGRKQRDIDTVVGTGRNGGIDSPCVLASVVPVNRVSRSERGAREG